ncbi:MAG TPA: hypothetical protein VFU86_18680 [Terriglobales bacterium]|nr:hypothetical protein [Terriglobales bacterium]
MMRSRLTLGLILAVCLVTSLAWADSLELKNGSLIKGKFVGGTDTQITFQVGSSRQTYNISDIVSLKFDSDRAVVPAAATPVPQPAADSAALVQRPPAKVEEAVAKPTQYVSIPAGTRISVRTIDGIDSTQNQVGDRFQASLEEPLMVNGEEVVPKGADVYGRLTQSNTSGTFTGKSQLGLELTGIVVNGRTYPLVTGEYSVAGKSRGASTAKRTIGGAAVGSIIGAIAGGGKGAAIGAGVGGGVGAGSEVITKGDQVKVPSETLLDFTLQQDASVPASGH